MADRFQDRVAVITGGASGIGEACARGVVAEGGRVAILDSDFDRARNVARGLGEGRAHAIAVDVSDRAAVARAMAQAESALGPLDILVNSAGIGAYSTVGDADEETWRRVHAVNIDGTFFAMQAFCNLVLGAARPASIVNLASLAGLMGMPNRGIYCSTKHAVVGLTKSMALELAEKQIRVNAVAPGLIRTSMADAYFKDPEMVKRIHALHPLGREGFPEEIAAAILFLASDQASFITGVVLPVDGGASAGKTL